MINIFTVKVRSNMTSKSRPPPDILSQSFFNLYNRSPPSPPVFEFLVKLLNNINLPCILLKWNKWHEGLVSRGDIGEVKVTR